MICRHNSFLVQSHLVSASRPENCNLLKVEFHPAQPYLLEGCVLSFTLTTRISVVKIVSMDFSLPKEELEDRFFEVPSLTMYSLGDDESMEEGIVKVQQRVLNLEEERNPRDFISSKPRDLPCQSLFFSILYY